MRGGRSLQIALIASLMLNLLFVGVVAGRWWADFRHHGHRGGMSELYRGLPDDRRKKIEALAESTRAESRAQRDEVRRLRRAARDVMTKEPFDASEVRQALERVSEARAKLRATRTEHFIALMSELTPQERREFLDSRRGRHGKRDDD